MRSFYFLQSKGVLRTESEKTTMVCLQPWVVSFLLWPHRAPLWQNHKHHLHSAGLRFLFLQTKKPLHGDLSDLGLLACFLPFFHFIFPLFFTLLLIFHFLLLFPFPLFFFALYSHFFHLFLIFCSFLFLITIFSIFLFSHFFLF